MKQIVIWGIWGLFFLKSAMGQVFINKGTYRYSYQGEKEIHTGLIIGTNCSTSYLLAVPQDILETIKNSPHKGLNLNLKYSLTGNTGNGHEWEDIVNHFSLIDAPVINYKTLRCPSTPFINPPLILPVLNYRDLRRALYMGISGDRIGPFEKVFAKIYTDFSQLDTELVVGNSFGMLLEILELSEKRGLQHISSEELITILQTFKPLFMQEFHGDREFEVVLSLLREIDRLEFSRTKKDNIIVTVRTKNDVELVIDANTFPIQDDKLRQQVEKMFSFIKIKPDASVKLTRDKNKVLHAKFRGFIARVRVPVIGMKVNVSLHSGASYLHAKIHKDYSAKFKVKIKKGVVGIRYTEKFNY